MMLLLLSMALSWATTVELHLSGASVGGDLTLTVEGATVGAARGGGSASGIPTSHADYHVEIRRYTDAQSGPLLNASLGGAPLDSAELRTYVPHPTLPGERLLVQATTLSDPIYITEVEVTLRSREGRGREHLVFSVPTFSQTSYAYDADGNQVDVRESDGG